jgi:hypothetical protein
MTINRSTLLDLPLPVTGTEDGTWGDVTNNGLTQYLDIAIAGMVSLTSSDFTLGDLTIALTEGDSSATNIANASAQYSALKVSSLAQNSTITAPGSNRAYKVINSDSTYSLTIKASGQTGVTFAPGTTGIVAFNGTDYEILGVVGPASATDNAVPKFDGTTGQIIQGSGVTIDDSNNVSGVAQLNATTADLTNLEVTNIKAKDGTASATITDSTGAFTISTELSVDNININGNTIVSSDTDGDLNLTPNGTGDLVLDGLKWPQADGTADYVLKTDGSGQLSWTEQTGGGGGGTSVTVTQATATAAQTDFSVTYTVGQLSVYLNGALLASADYTASNGTTVVLASGAALNDIFTAVAYSTVAGLEIESASPFMTAVGSGAGAVNTGVNNVFVGFEAGNDNTTGTNNTAVGYQALDANTTAIRNTAIGSGALGANTTGADNTAVGALALTSNTTGSYNTAVGFAALNDNTTGVNNVAMGCGTPSLTAPLQLNTTGGNNVAMGVGALGRNTTASNNTAFGYFALEANTTGANNVALGYNALNANTTGNGNVAIGFGAGNEITTGGNNICLGRESGQTGNPGGAVTTANDQMCLGNNNIANAFIKVALTVTSDAREKTNIGSVPHGLSFVQQLNPVSYYFRKSRDSDVPHGDLRYGFLAQDILPLEGDTPVIINNKNPDYLSYNGESLVPVLVNAIKELSAKCDSLQAEINTLKGQ